MLVIFSFQLITGHIKTGICHLKKFVYKSVLLDPKYDWMSLTQMFREYYSIHV